MMKVLITGANGQLGRELQHHVPADVEAIAFTRQSLDITNAAHVAAVVQAENPDVIINAAAYTRVDRAEQEPDIACAVNATGARNLAQAAGEHNLRLIHISTDFVFDGRQSTPYRPDDAIAPLGVYGASKAAGEQAVMAACPAGIIIRTAWFYAAHGQNFVNTMLRLMAEKDRLGIVADQIGTPTGAAGLAHAIYAILDKPDLKGIYHWTDAGVASWYDFAVAIQEEALALGLLKRAIPISPISTADYPTPAARPAYSVLDKSATWQDFGLSPIHWQTALKETLLSIKEQSRA
jgi:dTDP-4-dehydrorhamnose reductase